MLTLNTIDDVVTALATAPVDPRTGNRVLYSVNWLADDDSMIGKINKDWVRRELDWFNSGSDRLADMEGPVPALFRACMGEDGRVNSAYGHILFNPTATRIPALGSIYDRLIRTFKREGLGTRHATAIISDRDVHHLATYMGRNDFICTNALNVIVDEHRKVHIVAQMRSMDAVFGYRADYSMWEDLQTRIVNDLNNLTLKGANFADGLVEHGHITFQVANLHVYPRHFQLLEDTAADIEERIERRVWQDQADHARKMLGTPGIHFSEPAGTGEARS